MPAANLSRDDVIALILQVFRRYGYEGSSLARLSAATGLGRSSLYHYFPNGKEDMAQAAMQFVTTWLRENLFSALEGNGTPQKRLTHFAAKLSEFYEDGAQSCLMDVFSIGEAGVLFQVGLGERLGLLISALTKVIEEAGFPHAEAARRAENAVIAWEGALVVSRALGTTAPFLRTVAEFSERVLCPEG